MSLRVWLPLNGDLRNQGLDNVTVVNNGATVNDNGKIGKCYYLNGTSTSYIDTGYLTNIGTNDFSISLWVKIPTILSGSYYAICTSKASSAISVGFGIYWNYNQKKFLWSTADGSGSTEIWMANTVDDIVYDKWIHLVMVRNSNDTKIGYFYINNIRYELASVPYIRNIATPTNLLIGKTSSNNYCVKMYINDFRIYNHALSIQEIKKLAQGLILHYPLNNRGLGQENLLKNSNFDARYNQSTGWNIAKNGTLLANYWGGYNSGVANASTVYHAHLKEFNNDYVYEFIKTSDEQWLGIAQGGLQNIITAGKTYTFSWEEYHVNGTNRVATGLYYYKINATSANFHLGLIQRSDIVRIIGKWQRFSYTFVAPNDADYNKSMSWYVYGHYNNNGTFYARHFKLEEGDKTTSWFLNSSDDLYTTLQLNDTSVKDISGFNNNANYNNLNSIGSAQIGQALIGGSHNFTFNIDTPIYEVSTNFNHTDNYIIGQSPSLQGRTVTCWVKFKERGNQVVFIDYKSGCSFGIFNTYVPVCNKNISYRTCYSRDIFEANVWYFIAVVRNDTDQKMDLYVNGEKQTPVSSTDYWSSNISDKLTIGARTNGTTLFNGQMSDFRIYAIALSANDIKELYENREKRG